jgi:hypothetical protein
MMRVRTRTRVELAQRPPGSSSNSIAFKAAQPKHMKPRTKSTMNHTPRRNATPSQSCQAHKSLAVQSPNLLELLSVLDNQELDPAQMQELFECRSIQLH